MYFYFKKFLENGTLQFQIARCSRKFVIENNCFFIGFMQVKQCKIT